MARQFGQYSPVVPLGVTWEETYTLLQEDRVTPVDYSGYDIRAQFRLERSPVLLAGVPLTDPVMELTSIGSYTVLPGWPVYEAFNVGGSPPSPTTGVITQFMDLDNLWTASPTNAKAKLYMSLVLWNPETNYAIPVIQGRAIFLPAGTILPGVG